MSGMVVLTVLKTLRLAVEQCCPPAGRRELAEFRCRSTYVLWV